MPKTKVLRGAGYIRVSDMKQERNYSIAFQKEKIIAHFREQGIHLAEEHIFIETYTGKVWRQRKVLQSALAAAKRHEFDILGMSTATHGRIVFYLMKTVKKNFPPKPIM